jgi:hypothetical protein
MAATRNKNTIGNYTLQQRELSLARNYESYVHAASGAPFQPAMPSYGIITGKMSRDDFSKNSIDIESFLRGTNATNLVNPTAPVTPLLRTLPEIQYFNILPLIMPLPLTVENKQRPYWN